MNEPTNTANAILRAEGLSRRFDGTLVVDTIGLNDKTFVDNYRTPHSEKLHVVERFTPVDRDTINYEATLDDVKVFTKPWKMKMILYRRKEPNAQILD